MITSHHDKNYAGAVKNLNKVETDLAALKADAPGYLVAGLREKELTYFNSMVLHEHYFGNLGGNGKRSGALETRLGTELRRRRVGGAGPRRRDARSAAAAAGSCSRCRCTTARCGSRQSTNHTQALAFGAPLLVLDMYEHAYAIDYGAEHAAYIDAFFKNIAWDAVEASLRPRAEGARSARLIMTPTSARACARLAAYFLRLGTLGFGGPIALAGYMQRDLVERRGWIAPEDYKQGLALAQLAPGPLAAQLAIYLGWVRGRLLGATLVAFAFILPSFVMVLGARRALRPLRRAAVDAGRVLRHRRRGDRDHRAQRVQARQDARSGKRLAAVGASRSRTRPSSRSPSARSSGCSSRAASSCWSRERPPRGRSAAMVVPPWLLTGLGGVATSSTLLKLFLFFAEAGAFVFGSGLAIVPFLHGGVVDEHHWLTEQQFLDAVAVAMITPGPVVITVAFIGYLVAGPLGASAAALGVFLPCYLFVVIPAPYFRRIADNRRIKAFVDGVTAAATGAIAGAAFVLGRRAIVDVPTASLAVATFVLITRSRSSPSRS